MERFDLNLESNQIAKKVENVRHVRQKNSQTAQHSEFARFTTANSSGQTRGEASLAFALD
jgi:hypothetical protein